MAPLHAAYAIASVTLAPRTSSSIAVAIAAGAVAIFFAGAALVPRTPWGWLVALVAIALGLPSCAIVVAVPLAVRWQSPVLKAAFRRL